MKNEPSDVILRRYARQIRPYLFALRAINKLQNIIRVLFNGVCLGMLSKKTLDTIDEYYYLLWPQYRDDEHNRTGLFDWERDVVSNYFSDCHRLLLIGAGGGREVIALIKHGYEVSGFECNAQLVECANRLLKQENLDGQVEMVGRDECPDAAGVFDGAVVGWGTYMLIGGRKRRIAFLKGIRKKVRSHAPLLVSFFCRTGEDRSFLSIAAIGNILRYLLRRDPIEVGDTLAPNYVHSFTQDEIREELHQAGFELSFYKARPYGHCVGTAKTESEII